MVPERSAVLLEPLPKKLTEVLVPFDNGQNQNRLVCQGVEDEVREVTEWPNPHVAKPRMQSGFVPTPGFWLARKQVAGGFDGSNEAEGNLFTPSLVTVVGDAPFEVFDGFLFESNASVVHQPRLRFLAAGERPQTLEELRSGILKVAAVEGTHKLCLQRFLPGSV